MFLPVKNELKKNYVFIYLGNSIKRFFSKLAFSEKRFFQYLDLFNCKFSKIGKLGNIQMTYGYISRYYLLLSEKLDNISYGTRNLRKLLDEKLI